MDSRSYALSDITGQFNGMGVGFLETESFKAATSAAIATGVADSSQLGHLISSPELLTLMLQQKQMECARSTLPLGWEHPENIAPAGHALSLTDGLCGPIGGQTHSFAPTFNDGIPNMHGVAPSAFNSGLQPPSASMEILSLGATVPGQPLSTVLGNPAGIQGIGGDLDLSGNRFETGPAAFASPLANAQRAAMVSTPLSVNGQPPSCPKWIIPSGPRRQGEGIDDSSQNILCVYQSKTGLCVGVTLLVSGFIIGPGGSSIRGIQHKTKTKIKSWNQTIGGLLHTRTIRIFSIDGTKENQAAALDFLKAAVKHYKYLAEGACCGQQVDQNQEVMGIVFSYSPPPKSIVPHAAGIKPETCTPRFDSEAMATLLTMLGC